MCLVTGRCSLNFYHVFISLRLIVSTYWSTFVLHEYGLRGELFEGSISMEVRQPVMGVFLTQSYRKVATGSDRSGLTDERRGR